jgi:hypothetical protein
LEESERSQGQMERTQSKVFAQLWIRSAGSGEHSSRSMSPGEQTLDEVTRFPEHALVGHHESALRGVFAVQNLLNAIPL